MTVKELIAMLEELPPDQQDKTVAVWDSDKDWQKDIIAYHAKKNDLVWIIARDDTAACDMQRP